jgi:hypothetical protein
MFAAIRSSHKVYQVLQQYDCSTEEGRRALKNLSMERLTELRALGPALPFRILKSIGPGVLSLATAFLIAYLAVANDWFDWGMPIGSTFLIVAMAVYFPVDIVLEYLNDDIPWILFAGRWDFLGDHPLSADFVMELAKRHPECRAYFEYVVAMRPMILLDCDAVDEIQGEILEREREERFSAGKDYEEELRKKVQGPRGEV